MEQDYYKKYMTMYQILLGLCFLGVFMVLFFGDRRWAVLLLLLVTAGIIGLHMYIVQRTAREFWICLASETETVDEWQDSGNVWGAAFAPAYCQAVILLKKHLTEKYDKLLLNREARLEVLQSQINPHFLYNTLDSIRSDVQEAGLEKPAEMLEELAVFFRYSISEKEIIISLKEELKNVDTYMNIMRYRFGSRFSLVKYVDLQDEELMEFQMPKMLLQPLVENSINHGLESRLGEGLIVMHVNRTLQHVEIIVQDNGVGMDLKTLEQVQKRLAGEEREHKEKKERKGGLALENVNRRLKLYFGEPYGLSIVSTEGLGTEIRILMPAGKGRRNEDTV
ncbi:MAG: histidine kinase [Lachnospiraceae bacterium]|jgi:two-component system sensor histidine kinase YesM|nr:histidine kinase [Lachnospiraceae bacterium]